MSDTFKPSLADLQARVAAGLMPSDDLAARGQQTARPASLLDPSFQYVPANKTDVRATWARFGFKPKGE